MKKTAIISGITTGLLLIAFIISVAVSGVSVKSGLRIRFNDPGSMPFYFGGRGYAEGETTTDVFEGSEISNIRINISTAETTVRVSTTDKATVKYTAGDSGVSFAASLDDGTLRVTETAFFSFGFKTRPSKLEIELPEKEYGTVVFDTAAGKVNVNALKSDKLSINTASGFGDYNVFANDLTVDTASGSVSVTNCSDRRAKSLSVESGSGSTELSGFLADNFKVECASGSVKMDGVSGKGDVEAASGNIYISYAEWTADLDIEAASGAIDLKFPTGSGIDIDMSGLSGSVRYDIDGETGSLSGNSAASVGGPDSHYVNIELMSGIVNLHN